MRYYASQAKLWREITDRAPLTADEQAVRRLSRAVRGKFTKNSRRGVQGLRDALALPEKPQYRKGWAKIKAQRIAEHGPACEACRTVMPDEGLLHLHHIHPRALGGKDKSDNAALLCPNCHAKAHWHLRQPAALIPSCLADLLATLAAETPKPEKLGPLYILTA